MAEGKTNATVIIGGEAPTTGDYLVRYIDVDGTVLKEQWVDSGEDATPPTNPNYDSSYLTFSAWSKSSTNITNHKDIGALYTTLNNKSYAFITLTTASGLSPILYFYKSDGSTLTIDWGDSTQSTFTNSGNFNTGAHTYASVGNYVISMWISSGTGNYTFGNGSNTTMIFGSSTYKTILTKLYIGTNVVALGLYSFNENFSLEVVSIPSTVTSLGSNSFSYNYKLTGCILNENITVIPGSFLLYCSNLKNIVFPSSVSNLGNNALQYCTSITYLVLPTVSGLSLGSRALQYCSGLSTLIWNSSILYSGINSLSECYMLKTLIFPNGFLQYQGTNSYLYSLNLVDFPATTNNISSFSMCYVLLKVICRATTPPTLAASAFQTSAANSTFKIYVPDASVNAYKAATNWSAYANYIYPLSDIGE